MREALNPCFVCGGESGHPEEPYCLECEAMLEVRECQCCGCEMGYQSGKFCATCRRYEADVIRGQA